MPNTIPTDGRHLDVVYLVTADHGAIRALISEMEAAGNGERVELWPRLVRALVAHEVAEELVIFPAIRTVAPGASPVLDTRLAEQAEAEETMKRLDGMDPASDEFGRAVSALGRSVVAHAAQEDRHVLPLLVEYDQALDRPSLGVRYESAKRRAPTHPHPHAPDRPPGNVVIGPVAALFDRLRDAVH